VKKEDNISKIEPEKKRIERFKNLKDKDIIYDDDSLPFSKEDLETGKVKLITNNAKIDLVNYFWLKEFFPENMDIHQQVNTIIELYREFYENTQKVINPKVSLKKRKEKV